MEMKNKINELSSLVRMGDDVECAMFDIIQLICSHLNEFDCDIVKPEFNNIIQNTHIGNSHPAIVPLIRIQNKAVEYIIKQLIK